MQQVLAVTASGKEIKAEVSSLTPNCDKMLLDKNAPRLSVEYAKARMNINEDFKFVFSFNQPLAKKFRKEWKRNVVSFLDGKVSTKEEANKQGKMEKKIIVTFPDGSVARL